MKSNCILLCFAVCTLCATSVAAQQSYVNDRYGVMAMIPADFELFYTSYNGDGAKFVHRVCQLERRADQRSFCGRPSAIL